MTINTGTIGIVADDLTGANDTALQFHLRGCNTQILFEYSVLPEGKANTQAWAISTETRNKLPEDAVQVVEKATKMLIDELNVEYIYKKIDSTMRGNVAVEALTVLNAADWDAAIIVPAFPTEGRITIGGYHLLKGIPIERTEVARDPQAPIYESHIPTLLKSQIDNPEIVELIELGTVMNGAGPILMNIQEAIKDGKKLIVIDAASTTDIEQIALAVKKCNYNILPCGSAGLAQALAKNWLPDMKHQHIIKTIPKMPILVVNGSTTSLTQSQIKKLIESDELEPYLIQIKPEQLLSNPTDELIERALKNLTGDHAVIINSTPLTENHETTLHYAEEHGINPSNVPGLITDFLSELTQKIIEKTDAILILIGGETSYKCCNSINSKHLQLIDEVEASIPLCLDHKAQWIVTKSGNLGTPITLINILKYFKQHQ